MLFQWSISSRHRIWELFCKRILTMDLSTEAASERHICHDTFWSRMKCIASHRIAKHSVVFHLTVSTMILPIFPFSFSIVDFEFFFLFFWRTFLTRPRHHPNSINSCLLIPFECVHTAHARTHHQCIQTMYMRMCGRKYRGENKKWIGSWTLHITSTISFYMGWT